MYPIGLSPWISLECTWEIQKNTLEMWEVGREISLLLLTLWEPRFLQLAKGQPPLSPKTEYTDPWVPHHGNV